MINTNFQEALSCLFVNEMLEVKLKVSVTRYFLLVECWNSKDLELHCSKEDVLRLLDEKVA